MNTNRKKQPCRTKRPCSSCTGSCCSSCKRRYEIILTEGECTLLRLFAIAPFLPAARLVMRSSKTSHAENVALEPLLLLKGDDDVKSASKRAEMLISLEEKGLITIDYDQKLIGYDESEIYASSLFAYFRETVDEGVKLHGSIFDRAEADIGSMALTNIGARALDLIG